MRYNVHVIPEYANPKGNYGEIVNGFVSGARAIDEAEKLREIHGRHYVVSTGLITIFDTRSPSKIPQRHIP